MRTLHESSVGHRRSRRSLPQLVTARSLITLERRPTSTRSATVAGTNLPGARAFARYRIAEGLAWTVQAPVMKDGTFDLRGLPAGGAPTFGLCGQAGDTTRHVTAKDLVWPTGQGLDVTVRPKTPSGEAEVWVFRGSVGCRQVRRRTPSSRPASPERTRRASERGTPMPVANITEPVTSTALAAEPDARVVCKSVPVAPSVVLDHPDGNLATGVTPIVLEP